MAVLRRGGTPASPCRRGTSTRLAGKPGNRPDRASVLARATSWSPRTVVSIPQRLVRLSGKRARRLKEQDIDETLRNTPDPRPARHLADQRAWPVVRDMPGRPPAGLGTATGIRKTSSG